MGFRAPVRRSTLADANQLRDWRIYAELAQRLMAQKRKLYASQSLGIDSRCRRLCAGLDHIDLCLSLFPWATSVPQVGHQDTHAARSAAAPSRVHPRHQRRSTRCQHA